MAPPASSSDSPFTKEQEIWIILEWGATKNITTVKRNFRTHFKGVLQPVLRRQDDLWFQQDGAPPHMPARAWLQEALQGRVISRLTPIPWPAKSPDLSPLGLLVLGGGHGGGQEELTCHPQPAEGCGGGLCREPGPGGGGEVCQEHQEESQGLQRSWRRQLRGQPR